ncbi:hypothetical protein CL1_1074 [Thermococcus cleftensis]|uniref:Uncharacterized protein n=2 Tax=Thermococcus cleftensis (strain DSM 27260 / KACC 17922 / CL1) TaxID=163003 RepID=I3ZU93_THECF|nr:hypothetical protein CL1_1074 [Thermococcus cleftensis]
MIREYSRVFGRYVGSEEYERDLEERKRREALFSEVLAEERIKRLSEFELGEIISGLWATRVWTNKDYLLQRIISDNGMEKIRKELFNLLYGGAPFEERFDRFMGSIKGLGPASVTELLCLFNPREYGIWNDKARKALGLLGFDDELPLGKYRISGEEYGRFNSVAKEIAAELRSEGFGDPDLLFVDYFLYEVWRHGPLEPVGETVVPRNVGEFDHNEIRDHVRDIGLWLGFDAETEKLIAPGSRVDVVWRARIGNLGTVAYVFEIHRNGSIKSLILNLQKASRSSVVQKVIAVSDGEQLAKIRREVEGLPENFVRKLVFWDVAEVERTYEKLSEVAGVIQGLGLISSEFE